MKKNRLLNIKLTCCLLLIGFGCRLRVWSHISASKHVDYSWLTWMTHLKHILYVFVVDDGEILFCSSKNLYLNLRLRRESSSDTNLIFEGFKRLTLIQHNHYVLTTIIRRLYTFKNHLQPWHLKTKWMMKRKIGGKEERKLRITK